MDIEKLQLSPRARNALQRANIHTVEALREITWDELAAIRGIGVVSFYEITEKLYDLVSGRDGT